MSIESEKPAGSRCRHSRMFWTVGTILALASLAAGIVALETAAKRRALRELPAAAGWPAGQAASGELPELLLPDVTGLAGPEAAGPETVRLIGRQVPRITITIDRNGAATVGKVAKVSPWRGVDIPIAACPPGGHSQIPANLVELVVHLQSGEGRVRIRLEDWETTDLATFKDRVAEVCKACGGAMAPPVIAAGPDVPFGHVAGVVAALLDIGCEPEFRATMPAAAIRASTGVPAARSKVRALAEEFPDPDGLSALGVRIRADSRTPWGAVHGTMMFCVQAKVWRISFGCRQDGREAVLGRVRIEAAARRGITSIKPDVFPDAGKRDIFRDLPVEPPEPPEPVEPGDGPSVIPTSQQRTAD